LNQKLIWVFVFFFIPLFAAKTETLTLTLDDAVQRALDHSLSLKRSAIDLAQAEYSANRLWSEIFPGFNLSAGFTFLPSTPLISDPGFSYNSDALSYSFNLGLSLSLNASLRASMRRIELAYRSQLLSYENASKQLETQVMKAFLSLIYMRENIAFMQESLDLAEQKQETDRIAREHGMLSELTWLHSRLSVETARYNLSTAKGAYQTAVGEFLAVLGMDANRDVFFEGAIEIIPLYFDAEKLILEYLPKRPDIISQHQNIERLELARNVTTLSSRSPTLNLSTQWRGSSGSGSISAPIADSITGSVTLNIPIDSWIPGTRQNQTVRAANAELEKAILDLRNTEIQASTQIRSLVSSLRSTWESLEIAKLRVEIAQRTVEATEEGFRNGTVAFNELEESRKDLTDARQRFLQGELSYKSMLLDLSAALNVEWRTLTRG
jgi:outer membrane protein TolC